MAIPWDSLKTLILFFGPILIPKAISFYRSINTKSSLHPHQQQIQPIPRPVKFALALLTFLALIFFTQTLPFSSPENLFVQTSSRIQTPVDVLFNRLATARPDNAFTPSDLALRAKFVNLESRLLYLQFGPRVLADCLFCSADEPKSYFYYALPDLLWPHIINLIAIVTATSPTLNRCCSRWRTVATIAAAVLAATTLWIVSTYNNQINARKPHLKELDMFHWDMRNYTYAALAILDLSLCWLLYLSSTNRAFAAPPSPASRLESVNRALGAVMGRVNALAIVKNTHVRDEALRERGNTYWGQEVRLMKEVMEEKEVLDGVNDALENRIRVGDITSDADVYSRNVLQPLYGSLEKER